MSTFVLCLNDMRSPKFETVEPVAWGESQLELLAFLANERVEHYQDGPWAKTYRKGGPLEWFNPPSSLHDFIFELPTPEHVAEQARQRESNLRSTLPRALS